MRRSFGNAVGVSAVTHAVLFLLVLFITSRMPNPAPSDQVPRSPRQIVWMRGSGTGAGGGGGGNRTPAPARRAEVRHTETVRPPTAEVALQPAPPALPLAPSIEELPGVLSAMPSAAPSLGPGSDGGAGAGHRGGLGDGPGRGVGPGRDDGIGGGPYGPGDGVAFPQLIREVTPRYTSGALQARVEGLVELRAVVRIDGSVGDVWITRSLDRTFGLDEEAIRTVKQWRFRPGTKDGKPVAVVVPIELRFSIR
jgi:protein TonB